MADFPSEPISPQEFMEKFIPAAFAAASLPEGAGDVSLKLGVKLDGDGGGEWLLHLSGGAMNVVAGSRNDASFTVIQTVDDWRGALWEGRGGVFGSTATALFRGGAPGGGGAPAAPPNPALLQQLSALDGVVTVVVTGDEGGDWSTSVKLGPGEIPAQSTTTISISSADAAAMQSGDLDPMQAFMSGRIIVSGDMTLVMQMQAIAMQAAVR